MSNYRRWRAEGGTFFFTIVTYERRPIFAEANARRFLREAIHSVRARLDFHIVAIVLLPDHLHMIMELPPKDDDYSTRLRQIKTLFTRTFTEHADTKCGRSESREKRAEHTVWQRRFFEHMVRDETDLRRCADYIHVNPVKHGLVTRVRDWPWSSFHRWVRLGHYDIDWGSSDAWYGDEFKNFE